MYDIIEIDGIAVKVKGGAVVADDGSIYWPLTPAQ